MKSASGPFIMPDGKRLKGDEPGCTSANDAPCQGFVVGVSVALAFVGEGEKGSGDKCPNGSAAISCGLADLFGCKFQAKVNSIGNSGEAVGLSKGGTVNGDRRNEYGYSHSAK